jgi:hypothetical protein
MDGGKRVSFDPILTPEVRYSPGQASTTTRRYLPTHNIGSYRYAEYTELDPDGVPRGEVMPLDEILFPFDPALRGRGNLHDVPVRREPADGTHLIEESYSVDGNGIVTVTIRDLADGYAITHSLGKTAPQAV